jgi:glycosyltransferase involved in cell wall biosynthesis
MNSEITVSVCMITFNHEAFISQAIVSILEQECEFNIELVVLDDCSTDATDTVIKSILENHPKASRIKYKRHSENIGMMPNFIEALERCTGTYIALCDGDDYWTDKNKLQKQIEFLELNNKYVACFHNAEKIGAGANGEKYCNYKASRNIEKNEIIVTGGSIYPTASFVFRNNIRLENIDVNSRAGDTILIYELLNKGLFYYMNETMCVYRKHVDGVFTSIQLDKTKILADIKSNIKILIDYRRRYKNTDTVSFNDAIQKQVLRISNISGWKVVVTMMLSDGTNIFDLYRFVKTKTIGKNEKKD